MACGCMKHKGATDRPRLTRPDEPCVFCGEKHLATAYALAQEGGYEVKNRMRMIGELVLAQWHLWAAHKEVAEKIRDIRHAVQAREATPQERWGPALEAVSALTLAESQGGD